MRCGVRKTFEQVSISLAVTGIVVVEIVGVLTRRLLQLQIEDRSSCNGRFLIIGGHRATAAYAVDDKGGLESRWERQVVENGFVLVTATGAALGCRSCGRLQGSGVENLVHRLIAARANATLRRFRRFRCRGRQ
jgi:transketolase N-terminal domain/subunit